MWELEELGRDFISHVAEMIKTGIQAFKCDTANLRSKKKTEIDQPEWSWNPLMAASKYTRLHSRISKMVPPTSTGGAFLPRCSR